MQSLVLLLHWLELSVEICQMGFLYFWGILLFVLGDNHEEHFSTTILILQ